MPDPAHRLREVLRLYRQSRDLKLLASGGDGALRCLREAEALAEADPPLAGSLVALVQYRLGHLYLRRRRTQDDLEEAELAFRSAGQDPAVGPWALPYVLASLAAMRAHLAPDHVAERERLDARIEREWRQAATLVRRGPLGEVEFDEPIPLQHATFNLLELATCFLGFSQDELLRMAGSAEAEATGGAAIVVGHGLGSADDPLPFAVARDIVQNLARNVEGAIAFTLPPARRGAEACFAGGPWQEFGPESARLLALLLAPGAPGTSRQLAGALAGDRSDGGEPTGADRRRKTLERTRKRLAVLTGRPHLALLAGERGRAPVLAEGLRLYGAVDLARLREGDS